MDRVTEWTLEDQRSLLGANGSLAKQLALAKYRRHQRVARRKAELSTAKHLARVTGGQA